MNTAEMFLSLEHITPELARHYLKRNKTNRDVKEDNLTKITNDLANGNFKLSHQALAFDWNGNLIDGQHRLMAVIESNTSANMYVAYNCDPENFTIIDCGRSRTTSDVLKRAGASSYSTIAAAIRLILWASVRYAANKAKGTVKLRKHYTITNSETVKFFEEHKNIIQILNVKTGHLRHLNQSLLPSAAIAFLFLANTIHGDYSVAYEFLERVASGANLQPGSVELAFLKFINMRSFDLQNYKKGEFMLSAYIKAFNRYVQGDVMLQFRIGNVEPLPSISAI